MKKKRVALVLGSGGARGYAHIGVIEEIERRGYDIACIAGCSMGAVVGGIYAAGKLNDYRDWIESLDYLDVLRLVDVSFRLGAIRGEKVFGQIRKIVGEINIEDLRIPYTAVATDLTNQQEIWFRGRLPAPGHARLGGDPQPVHPGDAGQSNAGGRRYSQPVADRAGGVEPLRPDHGGQPQLHQPASLSTAGDPAPGRVQDPLRQPDQLVGFEIALPPQTGGTIAAAGKRKR